MYEVVKYKNGRTEEKWSFSVKTTSEGKAKEKAFKVYFDVLDNGKNFDKLEVKKDGEIIEKAVNEENEIKIDCYREVITKSTLPYIDLNFKV